MSLNELTKAINIKWEKNDLGFSIPINNISKYLFELEIEGLNGSKKIRILEENKCCYLIDIDDKIKLCDIHKFNLNLSIIPDLLYYNISDMVNHTLSSSISQTEYIYIEFTTSINGYIICKCYYKGEDLNKIFITPQ